jgi:hypothetical protein
LKDWGKVRIGSNCRGIAKNRYLKIFISFIICHLPCFLNHILQLLISF